MTVKTSHELALEMAKQYKFEKIEGINWNRIPNMIDKLTWDKLISQFWIPERFPVANDVDDWRTLSPTERTLFNKVFGGLTLLDTLQGETGAMTFMSDARSKHEHAVYTNIVFMECYDESAKLLTKDRGWVSISEITTKDTVLQYNKDGSSSFEKVLSTSSHIPKEMFNFKGNGYDLKVSGGHRMVYLEKEKKNNHSPEIWNLKESTARDYYFLPKTYFRKNILTATNHISDSKKEDLNWMDKFIIALQADGNIARRDYEYPKEDATIRFSFSKDRKVSRLKHIAEMAGLDITEISSTVDKRYPRRKIKRNFLVRLDKNLLKDFSFDKNFHDYFDLSDFNEKVAREFIEELKEWDAYNDVVNDAIVYYTANESNSMFVQAVSTLASYNFRPSLRKDERNSTYKNSHVVRISRSETSKLSTFQGGSREVVEQPTRVYGVEVPSSYLVVLTPKGTIISGNCVHSKSYSTIFSTLCTPSEIDDIFEWVHTNKYLQYKANKINEVYQTMPMIYKKAASVLLESFLFYSGFFTPLYYLGQSKMINTAEIIQMIIKDESTHGSYLGVKFRQDYEDLTEEEQLKVKEWVYEYAMDLWANELEYTKELYSQIGLTDKVNTFLEYNLNKTLDNLGFPPLFETTAADVDPLVLSGLSTTTGNHDFFSTVGNGYLMGNVEVIYEEDYNLIDSLVNR